MAEEPKLKECALFLVQYVPNLVRGESVNIGVFLHSPLEKYLGCMFTDDFRRIKRFHPQADLVFLRELQQDFEKQIDERGDDLDRYLKVMQQSFSNLIQMAEPRTCLLADPQAELHDIFARYVGPRISGPEPEDTRLRVKQKLTAALSLAGVWDRLDKHISASKWTQEGDPFTFDYGYRPLQVDGKPNGHVQLIHALSLKRDNALAAVLKDRILKVRAKERADLVAVVEALPRANDAVARSTQIILEEADIRIRPLAAVNDYAQSIRQELMM